MLADDLPYQREPFRAAMAQLQPRLLVADSVGLGKTIEIGMLLAELQRRGRAARILAVVPRHILDQVQHELWCRAGVPLVRLDSEGIQRLRQRIPAGRNPFTYFNRVIVSIDTIKNPSLLPAPPGEGPLGRRLDRRVAQARQPRHPQQPARAGARPERRRAAADLGHAAQRQGRRRSLELIALLDPTAVTDPEQVTPEDIEHLVVRRHKHSPDVEAAIGDRWAERADPLPVPVTPTAEEEAVFAELSATWIGPDVTPPCADRLFPWTLLKAALSSPAALAETIENRAARRGFAKLDQAASGDGRRRGAGAPTASRPRRRRPMTATPARSGSSSTCSREIGVGKKSATRAVVFSERIRTLDWIAAAIRDELGHERRPGPDVPQLQAR